MCFVFNIFLFFMSLQVSHSDRGSVQMTQHPPPRLAKYSEKISTLQQRVLHEEHDLVERPYQAKGICKPVNMGEIWAGVESITSEHLRGTCYIPKDDDHSDYKVQWLIGNTQIAFCDKLKSNELNYECKIDIPTPKIPGTLACRAGKKLWDETFGYCIQNVGLIIGHEDWVQYAFTGNELWKVWMEYIPGQPPKCYVSPTHNIIKLKVDWYIDHSHIGNCTEEEITSLGEYKRCDFKGEVPKYTGTLFCIVTATDGGAATGEGKSNEVQLMSKSKELRDGSESIGQMSWTQMSKVNITGGQRANVRCVIKNLSPVYSYSISWYLKQKQTPINVFETCYVPKEEIYYSCNAFDKQFPLYTEGDFYCKVVIFYKKKLVSSADSDYFYNVKSHPRIEVRNFANKTSPTIKENEYFEAECSVLKFDGYTLHWILPKKKEASHEDYEDKSNSSHNILRLRTKFDLIMDHGKDLLCLFLDSNNVEVDKFWIILNITTSNATESTNIATTNMSTTPPKLIDFSTSTPEPTNPKAPVNQPSVTTTPVTITSKPTTPKPPVNQQPVKTPTITITSKPTTPKPPVTFTSKTSTPKPPVNQPPVTTTFQPTTSTATTPKLAAMTTTDHGGHCEKSCIATIVGILITVVGNSIVFGVYCARKKSWCKRESTKRREFEARPGGNTTYSDDRTDEPSYSAPHKWLTRPSKKELAVSYTSLDLPPSSSTALYQREEPARYAEIVGVQNSEYAEVNGPEYSNLKPARGDQPVYSNTDEINSSNMAVYAQVLPNHRR